MKNHILIVSISLIIGFALISYFGNADDLGLNNLTFLHYALGSLGGVIMAYICLWASNGINIYLPWKENEGVRLLTEIVVIGIIVFTIWGTIFYFVRNPIADESESNSSYLFMKLGIIAIALSIIYSIIYFASFSFYQFSKVQIDKVSHERKQIVEQLKVLKSQLSPHFLFNSLNTISSLIYSDTVKAEMFIRKLANAYNYTLNNYHNSLVTLQEEIEFVKSYYFMLTTRYEDGILLNIETPPEWNETKIPPLTLQLLVENAVKHNQSDKSKPLEIFIKGSGNYISIVNKKELKQENESSFNIGLNNIKSRYKLLTGNEISIVDGEFFEVKLPLVK